MSIRIEQFKNRNNEKIAGLSPEHAIYDDNGTRLDDKLKNITKGTGLQDKSIITRTLADGAVNNEKIKDGTIELDKLSFNARYKITDILDDNSSANLNIGDPNGNVLIEFKDGHIKTKNFDSRNQNINNPLKGKRISIIGDSISTFKGWIPTNNATYFPNGDVTDVNFTWWKMLIDELELELLINQSWSGSRVGDGSTLGRSEIPFSDERRYGSLKNPDIILVFGGVNDCSAQSNPQPLGEITTNTTDSFNNLYTAQAFQTLAVKLTTLYPSSKIFFMIPLQHNHINWKNSNGWGHIELRDTIKKVADMYGINVIETYKCGITYYNKNQVTIDGLHPNKLGHILIKDYVKALLISKSR